MQIWDLCMLKMSDTGNHSESYPIPSSYETISLEPTKPNNDLHNNVSIKVQTFKGVGEGASSSILLPVFRMMLRISYIH